MSAYTADLRLGLSGVRTWPFRRWVVAAITFLVVALATGIPTDLVPTSLYYRMTPATWWNYPVWAISALLAGLVAATYVRAERRPRRAQAGPALGGGVLSFLAVGCPICNKLVVAALGAGGALTYFGPLQPALGLLSIALLAGALAVRLRALAACNPPFASSREE
jgi:hypothetical protein